MTFGAEKEAALGWRRADHAQPLLALLVALAVANVGSRSSGFKSAAIWLWTASTNYTSYFHVSSVCSSGSMFSSPRISFVSMAGFGNPPVKNGGITE